jgi:predicted alpha/beta-hydrolase family hydrolase
MESQRVSIPVGEKESVSGVISVPVGYKVGEGPSIILAHGAGNDMEHPLIVSLSKGLTQAGYLSLRFNFPYREKGEKAPDSQNRLELTWLFVYEFLLEHPKYAPGQIAATGKSMGGRVASQMVANGKLPASRLILYGYPLHPAGRQEKLRDAHLYHIKIPKLFFCGTRDSLCDLEKLKGVLKKLDSPWALEIIEGGDHSFQLPKSAGKSEQDVYSHMVQKTVDWLK